MNYPKYLPVDPDFYEILETTAGRKKKQKVFFFLPDDTVEKAIGKYKEIVIQEDGEFLKLGKKNKVRLDRIITINGKPGPAFDEYDNYANECLSCQAGYDD